MKRRPLTSLWLPVKVAKATSIRALLIPLQEVNPKICLPFGSVWGDRPATRCRLVGNLEISLSASSQFFHFLGDGSLLMSQALICDWSSSLVSRWCETIYGKIESDDLSMMELHVKLSIIDLLVFPFAFDSITTLLDHSRHIAHTERLHWHRWQVLGLHPCVHVCRATRRPSPASFI